LKRAGNPRGTKAAMPRRDAGTAAQRLLGLRQNVWRRRVNHGWALRHLG
jgi:hypothetical protein